MGQKLSCAVAVLAAGLVGAAGAQDVRNEGTGERRVALDKMVYAPAPIQTLLGGTEWIGQAPTAADLSGKVLMVVTWAEWYKPSHAGAMLAQRLLAQHGPSGLVVVGVHDKDGWEAAGEFAAARKLAYPIVRDADGAVRQALMVDQDPDIYVIDRAGNVRYADITTETAGAAVESLVNEDQASAASAMQLVEAKKAQERAEARRSGSINQSVTLENMPVIPFTKPTPEQYAATNWPKIDEELLREAQSIDQLTPPLPIPDGEWLNGKPNTEGKIIVLYVWHPADRDSATALMDRMEDLHRQRGRDIAVMGVMGPIGDNRSRRNDGGLIADKFLDIPITLEGMRAAMGAKRVTQPLIATSAFAAPEIGRNRGRSDSITGMVFVASSDGRVRRAASWRTWSQVQQAIDHLLREDPGVKARREAEDRYIRGNGG